MKKRVTILTLSVLGLVAVMAAFATSVHVFAVSSSTTTNPPAVSTSTTIACVDDVQQKGNYTGQFGCQTGPDTGVSSAAAEGAKELEP
ncbi:MAG TPA: hypothetical protein VFF30_17165 [Nitrososphaerales archaeon]|nr:hypothetical protein [Nitrososphaerales archaeon]